MATTTNHHNDHNHRCEEADSYDDLCGRCYYQYLADEAYSDEVIAQLMEIWEV